MDGRHLAPWSALVMGALFAVTGVEVRTIVPPAHAADAAAPPKTVDVQMIGDATGYRFAPATITIQRGDRVRFTLVSGPPHNVVFWSDSIPKGAAAALAKGMPNTRGQAHRPILPQGRRHVRGLIRGRARLAATDTTARRTSRLAWWRRSW